MGKLWVKILQSEILCQTLVTFQSASGSGSAEMSESWSGRWAEVVPSWCPRQGVPSAGGSQQDRCSQSAMTWRPHPLNGHRSRRRHRSWPRPRQEQRERRKPVWLGLGEPNESVTWENLVCFLSSLEVLPRTLLLCRSGAGKCCCCCLTKLNTTCHWEGCWLTVWSIRCPVIAYILGRQSLELCCRLWHNQWSNNCQLGALQLVETCQKSRAEQSSCKRLSPVLIISSIIGYDQVTLALLYSTSAFYMCIHRHTRALTGHFRRDWANLSSCTRLAAHAHWNLIQLNSVYHHYHHHHYYCTLVRGREGGQETAEGQPTWSTCKHLQAPALPVWSVPLTNKVGVLSGCCFQCRRLKHFTWPDIK